MILQPSHFTPKNLKDLQTTLDIARGLRATSLSTALVAQIENGLTVKGYGDDDVSAVGRAIREMSGLVKAGFKKTISII